MGEEWKAVVLNKGADKTCTGINVVRDALPSGTVDVC